MKTLLLLLTFTPAFLFAQQKGIVPVANSNKTDAGATYAVVVGVSNYQDKEIPDLRFADRDALAFANYLRSPAGGSLDDDHLKVLTNEQATAGRVAEAFDGLIEQAGEGDQVMIYFSGHGDVEGKKISQPGFLLCWDAPSRVYMGGGTYSLSFLQEVIATLSLQNKAKVIVITDACHAGKLAGSQIGGAQLTSANLAKQYANEIKILSCQPNEFSLESEQWGGGRGVFSYHLVEGLLGLADRNKDGFVTVGEIDRYLEDKVTVEAAPQSQVPILLGNKAERLATVNKDLLEELEKRKDGGIPLFAATDSRGLEEEVLAKVDSTVRKMYIAFKLAVQEKRFFTPDANAADHYYNQLVTVEALAPLQGLMKRNYAAALQDFAQQSINAFLKADVQQMECIGRSPEFDSIPRQLGRAAELLGEQHYMYHSLIARKLLYEGIILRTSSLTLHSSAIAQCLSLFRQSMALEPQSPLGSFHLSLLYAWNIMQPDSAFYYAQEATKLAPNWVLPYAELAYTYIYHKNLDLCRKALEAAEAIDPKHPYVISRWAVWHTFQEDQESLEKAVSLFEKYRENGGVVYPCWFSDYARSLIALGKNQEAEAAYFNALELDPKDAHIWSNLGAFYIETGRFDDAEQVLKKAVEYDSTFFTGWINLSLAYMYTRRHLEAVQVLKKAISIDSTFVDAWGNLGAALNMLGRLVEAEPYLLKSLSLDSTNAVTWSNLGFNYIGARRYEEAEHAYKKSLAINSINADGWNNLGYSYLNSAHYVEAEQALKMAISLNPAFPNPHRHLGMVCFKTNRLEEAQRYFLKAVDLNPNYTGPLLGMAYLLQSEGKTTEAMGYVERAIGKGSSFGQLNKDEELAPLRSSPEWKVLMKKYFPEQMKE